MKKQKIVWALSSVMLLACGNEKAKIGMAQMSGCTIRTAALSAMTESSNCPTVTDLVGTKRLSENKPDPWGTAYAIQCNADEVTVVASGPDQKLGTPDDVTANATTCRR